MEKQRKYLFQSWKKRGVKGDYQMLYEIYINTHNCEKCSVSLDNDIIKQTKCLDHDHDSGLFRAILCWDCNIRDQNRQGCKIRKDNISGFKNISYHSRSDSWCIRRQVDKETIRKYFPNKIDAICYKYILLLKIKSKYY